MLGLILCLGITMIRESFLTMPITMASGLIILAALYLVKDSIRVLVSLQRVNITSIGTGHGMTSLSASTM